LATNNFRPEGVMAACITPFNDDESIDFDRLATHIEFLLAAGIKGILTIGGSGEYANLLPEERRRVVTETIRLVEGRVPVIVGCLGPSTREAVDIGRYGAKEGANALLVLPPYYIKPSFDGVLEHFETVAKEVDLPIVAYNIPSRTGWPLELSHLQAIADIPQVVALKECERDMASISLKIAGLNGKMALLSGDDDLGFATLLSGGAGAIWASPNLHPKLCVDLYEACAKSDVAAALPLHNRLVQVFSGWMLPNHPGPLKEAMGMVGRSVGAARKPLAPMSDEQRLNLKAVLNANGPVE
jgi:4-hydroxy-tetrahydrodipicolinate synthase